MKDKDFDRLIENTLNEYGDKYFAEPEETEHRFSAEFDRRVMEAAKPQKKKNGAKILRIVTAVSAVAAVAVVGVVAFGALRNMWSDMQTTSISSYSATPPGSAAASSENRQYGDAQMATNNAAADEILQDDAAEADDIPGSNIAKSTETAENDHRNIDSASSSSCTVTARSGGRLITLSEDQISKITQVVQQLISDDELSVDQVYSTEEIDRIKREGSFITIRSETGNIILGEELTPYSTITVFLDGEDCCAVAEGEDVYMCFNVRANEEAYRVLSEFTEE